MAEPTAQPAPVVVPQDGVEPILRVNNLTKVFPLGDGRVVQACQDISIELGKGQTLGLVGESGSGKTTLGRCILRLIEPTSGEIVFDGVDLMSLSKSDMRKRRGRLQIVFQEPLDSLNPRLTIASQIGDGLRWQTSLSRRERKARITELLEMVGLPDRVGRQYPANLSPGTAQRCSIARALATSPDLIVLDEPTSSLAPEAEAELILLLRRLQQELGVSYVFISHNLSLVGELCDSIAVLYLSEVMEYGSVKQVFDAPRNPYTRALLAATLVPEVATSSDVARRWERLEGEIPSPIDLPRGCYLASRCLYVKDRCREEPQQLEVLDDGRTCRCWRVAEGDLREEEFAETQQRMAERLRARADVVAEQIVGTADAQDPA